MNGYVRVSFDNSFGKLYTYAVPDNIPIEEIANPSNIYAVVENRFYNPSKDISPYKIVRIKSWQKTPPKDANKVTKYIVDVIDSERYKRNRTEMQSRVDCNRLIDEYFTNLSYPDKIAMLLNSMSLQEFEDVTGIH